MLETWFTLNLPTREAVALQRQRFFPEGMEGSFNRLKRLSLLSGIHGDELEGLYVCYRLASFLKENPRAIRGVIDIYPSLNPLGVNMTRRFVPFFEVDLNRMFPGDSFGSLPEKMAHATVHAVSGSSIAVDLHASNIFLKEIPQVRIDEGNASKLLPLAKLLNVDFVWVYPSVTVLRSTLAHTLNAIGVRTLVVEMGVGLRVTPIFGDQLVSGLIHLMAHEGFLSLDSPPEVREPIVSINEQVYFINAGCSGLFIPGADHGGRIGKEEVIGQIVSPFTGEGLETLRSPADGLLFTLRAYPIVFEGSLVARVCALEG
jgi:hypothetical protein